MNQKTKFNAGESIVEVMASVFVFLIMIGILQGAISYATASMNKNKQIRADNVKIIEALNKTSITSKEEYDFRFVATYKEMNVVGNQVFTIHASLAQKKFTYTDTKNQLQTMTFYVYEIGGQDDEQ